MMKHIVFGIIFIIIFSIYGCKTYNSAIKNKDVSFIYNPSSTPLHPEYYVYHNTDSTSQIYIKIKKDEVLFETKPSSIKPEANIKFHYKLIDSFQSNNLIDSGTYFYNIEQNEKQNFIILDLEIKTSDTSNYILDIIANDLNRDKGNQHFIYIKKNNNNYSQNFLVKDYDNDIPVFTNYINNQSNLTIKHKSNTKKFYISYYGKKFIMPPPPFSITRPKQYNIKPDSVWCIEETEKFSLQQFGMYHIQTDTSQKHGITFYNFGEFFPEIKTQESLLEPIKYLTTSREYKEYDMFENKKNAVDNYWVKAAGNANRARELIRIYYTRVKYANIYFSCHTEGWKTDRGMIYTIYGHPKIIYKTDDKESWVYGTSQSVQTMTYTFYKIDNPFSENDFQLERSEIYKIPWYQAIETWRSGRAYSIGK